MRPASFNLLNEPWIPVEDLGGATKEVGLRELFARAKGIKRIVHPSPVVTAALYRTAFAIMHRSVQADDIEDWQAEWDAVDFGARVEAYLDRHEDRFDLFCEEAPFWQVVGMPANCRDNSWTKLALELPPNSSKLLFDHTTTLDPPPTSPANAARVLVAAQSFAVGAGKSCLGYTTHAPLVSVMVVIPEGRDLAETLLVNLMPGSGPSDLPVWERPPLTANDIEDQDGAIWTGPASRLAWPSRAVHLTPDADGVRWIKFAMGWRPLVPEGDRDPWASYRVTKDGRRVPRRLDADRMAWRDFHAMLEAGADGEGEAVQVLTRLAHLEDADRPPPLAWTLLVVGVVADKASVKAWRQERWRVPDMVVRDRTRQNALRVALSRAEEHGEAVRGAAWTVAFEYLGGADRADRAEAGLVADKLPASSSYWSSLEASFQSFLQRLGDDVDAAQALWLQRIAVAVQAAADATHAALGRDAKALRAWAKGAGRFERAKARLKSMAEGSETSATEEVAEA